MHNAPFYREQWGAADYYEHYDREAPIDEPDDEDEDCTCDECGNGFSQSGHTGWAIKCLDGSILRLCSHCYKQMSKEDLLDLIGVTYTDGYDYEVEAVASEWETEKRRKETVFATPQLIHEAV